MRFKPYAPKIALVLPVLGALMTSTVALPTPKNRFRPDGSALPLDVVRERVNGPVFRYAEVPVELKEGTAVPEPALVPNHPSDDEIIDRACNREVRSHHGVASAIKDRFSVSENDKTKQDEAPYNIEDIAPIEKRDVSFDFTEEDEEDEGDNPAHQEEFSSRVQKHTEKQAARIQKFLESQLQYGGEDWKRGWRGRRRQGERPEEAKAHAPHYKHVAKPVPAVKPHVSKPATAIKPHEHIPDHFDGYVQVPITPDNTTTAKGADSANIHAYLQNRFKQDPVTTTDTPEYAVPVDLLPKALLDAEDLEGSIEHSTNHRLTVLDVKTDEPAPEATTAEAEVKARASPSEATPSISSAHITTGGRVHIPRPVIQH
ncbi:hypothetical protein HOY80DRAFT_951876 [Tuber brumale]|nr:hypothetical protein HOY80DRAFT_951876 [Tuber brumale]